MDRLNDWLTLATNIGVLVGLFLVIEEINQNTTALHNEVDVAIYEQGNDHASLIVESPEFAALSVKAGTADWESLTDVEKHRMNVFWDLLVGRTELHFRVGSRLGEVPTRETIVFPEPLAKNPNFLEWWRRNDYNMPPEFRSFFDAYLEEVTSN